MNYHRPVEVIIKKLVFIATDRAPTVDTDNINVNDLEPLMNEEHQIETNYVLLLLSTDDPACIYYLTEWDQKMINVHVTNDYNTERDKARSFRGSNF